MGREDDTRPRTLDRLERTQERFRKDLDALRDKHNAVEKEMLQLSGTLDRWRTESDARDREQSASIERVEDCMSSTQNDIKALSLTVSGGFDLLRDTITGLKLKEAKREAVELDRKERAPSHPTLVAAGAPTLATAPPVAPAAAPGAPLAQARGWVELLKSIPPIWILILLMACIGIGITVGGYVIGRLAGWF